MIVKGQKRQENVLYGVLWAGLFTAPVLSMYIAGLASGESEYNWQMVQNTWALLAFFAITFAIHNLLLAPLLVYANRKLPYALLAAALLAAFTAYQCNCRPHAAPDDGQPPHNEAMQPPPEGQPGCEMPPPPPQWGQQRPPQRPNNEPTLVFGGENMVAVLIMTLLLGLNVGAKYYFKSLDDRKRMKELEYEHLHQKLESLTYQISPHFLMNTLNNIHALVAFDPDKAETTIEALSDLMRHVLYEGSKKMVPLSKEVAFVRNYVDIERIRCTDAVSISLSLPDQVPEADIPPMVFITFVENAFKHGISYARPSYVDIKLSIRGKQIEFECRNSRIPAADDKHGGVGLVNATKRLRLIYGTACHLETACSDTEYSIRLTLPLTLSQ